MAKLNWNADRRRQIVESHRREAVIRFMDGIIEARTGPVIPDPVKRRKQRRPVVKPVRTQKPKSRKQRRVKPQPVRKDRVVERREEMLACNTFLDHLMFGGQTARQIIGRRVSPKIAGVNDLRTLTCGSFIYTAKPSDSERTAFQLFGVSAEDVV